MTLGRRVQPVHRVGCRGHRREKAERVIGGGQVVVDGFGTATIGNPTRRGAGRSQSSVATDDDEGVQLELAEVLEDRLRSGLRRRPLPSSAGILEELPRLLVRSSVPPLGRMPRIVSRVRGKESVANEAFESQLDAHHFEVMVGDGRAHGGPDHGVESRAVAASGQNA